MESSRSPSAWGRKRQAHDKSVLTKPEAMKAAKAFKTTPDRHDTAIFDRVQQALAYVVG